MSFPWNRNQRGGGGDPFRDSSGRPVTNVRAAIPVTDALKEGLRQVKQPMIYSNTTLLRPQKIS
jgi:hypothetical protein